jgi:hypothetical protein
MKKAFAVIYFFTCALISIPFISAQSTDAAGFRGQSMNGATGLFSIPSGRVGWDKSKNVGLDFGYRAIINNDMGNAHIPAVTMTLFRTVEISAAFDIQPELSRQDNKENNDLLLGLKFKLPTAPATPIAIGFNFHPINIGNEQHSYFAYQPYIAITYRGTFFAMPAETSIVFGKTFYSGGPDNNSNIDFGMGFDIILFPDVFKNAVHWIIDFANFGYSDHAWPNNWGGSQTAAVWRGILNTGFRIDISSIPALNNFKFLVDFIFNDLFDAGYRSFTVGAVFGLEI